MAREAKSRRWNWRLILSLAGLAAVTAATVFAVVQVRRFVTTDAQFTLSRDRQQALEIAGLHYGSRAKVMRTFAPDFGRSIFTSPLEERRHLLLGIDWVEDASVSRVWPDRIVARIRERKPVAFVLLRAGVQLIDSQGVLLEPPAQAQFAFPVLSGIAEKDSLETRHERVRSFLRVQQDLGYLAKDLSEVDAADPDNIRVVVQVEDRAVELLLGDSDFGRRYQNFLSHYPEIRKRSPEVKRFDLRLDDRITAKE
jgi:cell division protein FtsQ